MKLIVGRRLGSVQYTCLLTDRCSEETQSDYVILSNFNVDLIDRKMSPLCGNHVTTGSTLVVSDGNFFRVSFKSNDVFDAIGFDAYFEFRQFEGETKRYEGVSEIV